MRIEKKNSHLLSFPKKQANSAAIFMINDKEAMVHVSPLKYSHDQLCCGSIQSHRHSHECLTAPNGEQKLYPLTLLFGPLD